MKIIRRRNRGSQRLAERVAGIRWVVWAWRDGAAEIQGAHDSPHDARREARAIRKATGLRAWVRMAG